MRLWPAGPVAWFLRLPGNLRGAWWLVMSAVLFTAMAVLTKTLGDSLHALQIAFFRALFGLLVILPFLLRASQTGGIATSFLRLQILRGVIGTAAMMCGFYAIVHLPLADAQALNFARVLFIAPLAVVILGESVGSRRILATIAGFVGVLIMLRPAGTTDPAALAALAGAALVALAVILVKIVSVRDAPVTLMFYTGVVGILVSAAPAFWNWTAPSASEWALLVVMGIAGAGAHNCFIRAFRAGEASALAPVDYSRLIFAALAGYAIFATVPDIWTITGAAIIVGATLYIVRREMHLARHQPPLEP